MRFGGDALSPFVGKVRFWTPVGAGPEPDADLQPFADLRAVVNRLDQPPASWDIAQKLEASPAALRIADWIDALSANPAAAMPQ